MLSHTISYLDFTLRSCDALIVDDMPQLRFASKNARGQQHGRSIRPHVDTWTLVSTVDWAQKLRPAHQGRWNKKAVGEEIIRAFGRATRRDVSSVRLVVPAFHWQGCSPTTRVSDGFPPCVWDSTVRLGFCGDIFGGLGMPGA